MDRRIKIRHLQAFIEITRQRSLKRAAERLALTQPAISRTLSELEDILGASLLTRDRSGVAVTAQGDFFLVHAQASLSALEQGLSGLKDAGHRKVMALKVGALPSVAARLMPQVARELSVLAPDLHLTVADGSHAALTEQLRDGLLDLVIGRLGDPQTMRGLSFTQLYLEEVAVVVRPGHPILTDPDLRRIVDWTVLYPDPSAAIRPIVERFLIAEGIALPPNRIETVSGAFGRAFTAQSDAIWLISAGVVEGEVQAGRLVRLPVATRITEGPVGLMACASADPSGDPDAARHLFAAAVNRAVSSLGLDESLNRLE
ncbi:pca operon transcription factor PcaQ [Paracoccus rhizosphaerae]|uniref:Pca operon transcription factor PcaQ n=1 Tax=Paracoccus rhizosphaerae TaxID=1133347 RepID=A0ABV6CSQ9_9RHOB|nr:pca operon transcription factor PcaQ [Paracoccus rhizosphaerae]